MIEWVVIGCVVYLFLCVLFIAAWPVFVGPRGDEYLPGEDYAEDFAARMSGAKQPGSAPLSASESPAQNAEPGDIVYAARTGPRDPTNRPTPADGSLGRSAAEKDRPLKLVP